MESTHIIDKFIFKIQDVQPNLGSSLIARNVTACIYISTTWIMLYEDLLFTICTVDFFALFRFFNNYGASFGIRRFFHRDQIATVRIFRVRDTGSYLMNILFIPTVYVLGYLRTEVSNATYFIQLTIEFHSDAF